MGKTEDSSSDTDSEPAGNKTAALATCLTKKNRSHPSSSSSSKPITSSKRSESESSEMDRLHLSDTDTEISKGDLPPKLKEEGFSKKTLSKTSNENKEKSRPKMEIKRESGTSSSKKGDIKPSSKRESSKGKTERDKLIDKKMSKIFGSSSDEDEESSKASKIPSTAPICSANNLLMPVTARSQSLEAGNKAASNNKSTAKVKASSMFDTDSSDEEMNAALKKSVDAMTSGVSLKETSKSSSSMKLAKSEPPALMSDDDMLDRENMSRPHTPGLQGKESSDRKSDHKSRDNDSEGSGNSSNSSKRDKRKSKKDKKDKHRRISDTNKGTADSLFDQLTVNVNTDSIKIETKSPVPSMKSL